MDKANVPATTVSPGLGFFEQYGSTAAMNSIRGTLIRFSKGDWTKGRDDEEIEEGTRFTVVMEDLQIGWQRWTDKKPTGQHIGRLKEGFTPPKREALGDDDEDLWDVDKDGKPIDPWQFTNILILKKPGSSGLNDEDVYTFSTSSRGGINAVGDLCNKYVQMCRERGDGNPVVELRVDSYKHADYGKIKKPILKVVDWEPAPKEEPVAIEAPKAAAKAKPKGK